MPKLAYLAVPLGILCLANCAGGSKKASAPPTTIAPFVASDAGFSAVFPTGPKRQSLPLQEAGISLNILFYSAITNREQVAVAYISLPEAPSGPAVQAELDDAINGAATNVKGTVTSRSTTTYLGQPAEDGVISAPGAVVRVRVVIIGDKRYLLEGVTSTAGTLHPHFDTLVASFKTR